MAKRYIAGGFAVLAALSLAACGGGGGAKGTQSGSAEGGTVKLTMVDSLTNTARTELINQLLDQCEAIVPNVEVELVSPPTEQADQKIQQMLQAGSGIDILEVRDNTVGSSSTNGWLLDMGPYFKDWEGTEALTDTAKIFVKDKDMWQIPYGFFGLSLFYRTDLVKEAGFDSPPVTWEDLLKQASTIQDPDAGRYGYAFRGGKLGYQNAVQVITSYVADEINTDNAYFLKDGSTIFSTPQAKDALNLYVDLFKQAAPPSSISWGFAEMVEGFSNGSTAFLLQDPEVITALEDGSSLTPEQWTTTPVLQGPEGKAFQALAYGGWGVASSSKHPDQAVDIIKCLSSGDRSATFSQSNNQIPILKAAQELPFYQTGPWKSYFEMTSDPETWIVGAQPREASWWVEWTEIADSDLQSLYLGKTSVDDLLAKWDQYWTEKGEGR